MHLIRDSLIYLQCDTVVIPLVTQHYMMLARNLLYTGVTRGKRLVVLVGQRKALAIAVRSQGSRRRWSKPRDHLTSAQGQRPCLQHKGLQPSDSLTRQNPSRAFWDAEP